ncbi:MAG: SUMF1/EgtB/PvdO family nonheme iron enzyme [Chlorobiaceae bacterium]
MAVTWLHVSDFHLSGGAPYDQTVILRSLVKSVRRFRNEGSAPDLIFATGDIAQSGKAEEYEQATRFFDELLAAAGLNRDRLFIVPGNHDVDRKKGKFLARTLASNNEADEFFDPAAPIPHLTLKLQAFSAWYNRYFKGFRTFPTNTTCSALEIVQVGKSKVAVLPLNSSLFCIDDHDNEQLFIGCRCLDKAKEQLEQEADLRVTLIHHPLDWLNSIERAKIKAALSKTVDLVLHGHYHETETESIVSANGGYLKLAAGAAYQKREWPNSAMYVTFDNHEVTIFPIRYADTPHEVWTLDSSVFPFNAPTYTKSFPITQVGTVTVSQGKNVSSTTSPQLAADLLCYQSTLKEQLGNITLSGSPAIASFSAKLSDTFVSLRLSDTWRSENRVDGENSCMVQPEDRVRTPEEVMKLAFQRDRLMLVIGDPGSGKTTLLKYYVLSCFDHETARYRAFGFNEPLPVFYLPLRDFKKTGTDYEALPAALTAWSKTHFITIPEEHFSGWLDDRTTLVLLDGLDEISNVLDRIALCSWIDRTVARFPRARFVVTSRSTGYRKGDGIEIVVPHKRADVMDFTAEQQETFLQKWFAAAFLRDLPSGTEAESALQEQQQENAAQKARSIITFLNQEENKGLRSMAGVPLLLQIMAILWKEREFLPGTLSELYDAALNYLLDYRDSRRGLKPLLSAREARLVLGPVSLWMQEELGSDEADREQMQQKMQAKLQTLQKPPSAENFCRNLVDRAGLLVAYGSNEYRFSHKTFREYLAGMQLKEDRPYEQLNKLVTHFGSDRFDWWREPLRFFIAHVDEKVFDAFMQKLFDSPVSKELSQKQQDLLQLLVQEAPQKKSDALKAALRDPNQNRQRYVVMCLKTIGSADALEIAKQFEDRHANATDFRNPFEQNAHYILIKGGTFTYSLTGQPETVPDLYVAKYPVTNGLYRQFISYLQTGKAPANNSLPLETFRNELQAFAKTSDDVAGFSKYLQGEKDLATLFQSDYDAEKRFNKEDQPVVGVTWYGARAYCLWLSLLENGGKDTALYCLPTEIEWEYAAAGKEGRTYPWGEEEPTPQRANYNLNEGATTTVGRYPEGATPEGLHDMAGNVDEWMNNKYADNTLEAARSLRGGSWYDTSDLLRCSARDFSLPVNMDFYIGFRVVCSSHSLSF